MLSLRDAGVSALGGDYAESRGQDCNDRAAADLQHRPLQGVDPRPQFRSLGVNPGAQRAHVLIQPIEPAFHSAGEVVEALVGPGGSGSLHRSTRIDPKLCQGCAKSAD